MAATRATSIVNNPMAWSSSADALLTALWATAMAGNDIAAKITACTSPSRTPSAVYTRAHTLNLPPKPRGGDRRSELHVVKPAIIDRTCVSCRREFQTRERYIFACKACHDTEDWKEGVNDDPYEMGE